MAKHQKSKFIIYLEYVPFLLLYRGIQLLPLRVGYAISAALFRLMYYCDGTHRRRTVSHMLHAGVARTPHEARAMARRCYRHFSMLMVEIVKMGQCYRPEKTRLTGNPEAVAILGNHTTPQKERCSIIVSAHYGNWEVAGTALARASGNQMVSIMRPFSNPLIGELILQHRRSDIHTVVNKDTGLRALLHALHEGKLATLLIDQHASRKEGVETTFFGHPCRTHMTPALLHLKTGVPIIPEITRRVNDNFEFELVLGKPIVYQPTGDKEHDIRVITQMCTTELENLIAEQPDQWLWTARRWLDINRGPYVPEPAAAGQ